MRKRTEERIFFPWSVKEPLMDETGGVCAHCGAPLDRYGNMTVDHVIPLNRGGTNDPENLTVLCEGCNQAKSDMVIPPMQWYAYLPAARRRSLQKMLDQYIKDTDFLAKDCLLPLDMFDVRSFVEVTKNCRAVWKVMAMPVTIHGTRMARDDAFAWLMRYGKSLQYRDQKGMLSHPSQFEAPCYLMKKGDIEMAMVNPWMIHQWDESLKGHRNEIMVDMFFHPDLPDKGYLPKALACMVDNIETAIARSISMNMDGACAILFRTRCFLSDRFCGPVFDLLTRSRNDEVIEFSTGYSLPARIRELTAFHIIGEKAGCLELSERLDAEHKGTMSLEEAVRENADLDKRFEK